MSPLIGTERFSKVALFEGLAPNEIGRLLEIAEDIAASEGERIVEQGEPAKGLYIIAAGAFEVIRKGPEGETKIARLEELSHFGDMALVSDQPHGADVVCVEAGRLKRLPSDKFQQLLDNDDLSAYKVVANMAHVMAKRLQKLGEKIVEGI